MFKIPKHILFYKNVQKFIYFFSFEKLSKFLKNVPFFICVFFEIFQKMRFKNVCKYEKYSCFSEIFANSK